MWFFYFYKKNLWIYGWLYMLLLCWYIYLGFLKSSGEGDERYDGVEE